MVGGSDWRPGLESGLRWGLAVAAAATGFGILGLSPGLAWIPEAPLLIAGGLVPALLIFAAARRTSGRAGRRSAVVAAGLAGGIGGAAGGVVYVAYGKPALNIAVGLLAGGTGGCLIGALAGRRGRLIPATLSGMRESPTRLRRLVERFGRIEAAAILSLIWAVPMAAWAGSVDLEPGPLPWLALAIGVVMLAVWLFLVRTVRSLPEREGPGRYRVRQMTASELRWNGVLAVSLILLIGWLNGAATVEWGILIAATRSGQTGPVLLAVGLLVLLFLFLAAAALSWRRAGRAFRERPPRSPGGGPLTGREGNAPL